MRFFAKQSRLAQGVLRLTPRAHKAVMDDPTITKRSRSNDFIGVEIRRIVKVNVVIAVQD